jgi:hypothetical protein
MGKRNSKPNRRDRRAARKRDARSGRASESQSSPVVAENLLPTSDAGSTARSRWFQGLLWIGLGVGIPVLADVLGLVEGLPDAGITATELRDDSDPLSSQFVVRNDGILAMRDV